MDEKRSNMKRIRECVWIALAIDLFMFCLVLQNKSLTEETVGKEPVKERNQAVSGEVSSHERKGKIAITFDDGPHPLYTEPLLDGLKERGVCATFFVTGQNARLHPDMIKRMQEEGHLIGNHTYSHVQLTKSNEKEFREELVKTNQVIYDITGVNTEFVRPPYGSWNKKFEEELNMFPVLWTVDPEDWRKNDVGSIVKSVIRKAEENDIILMHDYFPASIKAALQIVDQLKAEGYDLVTVDEILLD